MRSANLRVTDSGITRIRRRPRPLPATSIRRIYLYTDANGDECVVARGSGLRLQFVTRRELADPVVRLGMTALIAAVRADALVDDTVATYLASFASA